jgi:hypothetical protein
MPAPQAILLLLHFRSASADALAVPRVCSGLAPIFAAAAVVLQLKADFLATIPGDSAFGSVAAFESMRARGQAVSVSVRVIEVHCALLRVVLIQ